MQQEHRHDIIPSLSGRFEASQRGSKKQKRFLKYDHASNTEDVTALMTISEVAKILRVDATTVRRWIQNGILEAIALPHLGKRHAYRVKRETVNHIMGIH